LTKLKNKNILINRYYNFIYKLKRPTRVILIKQRKETCFMKPEIIARMNHAFYFGAVGMELCGSDAFDAVKYSLDHEGKALMGIEIGDLSGYLEIDTTALISDYPDDKQLARAFASAVNDRILGRVAHKIPYGKVIKGDLNDEVEIVEGIYKFNFKITKYERDRNHDCVLVDDPETLSSIPDDEILGRNVELKITIA